MRSPSFFPAGLPIVPSVAIVKGMQRAADGILMQTVQETDKPSIDALWAMEQKMRIDILNAVASIKAMVPTSRKEAYARSDLLILDAIEGGLDYSEIAAFAEEAMEQAEAFPDEIEF